MVKVESSTTEGLSRVIHYRDFERIKGIWTSRTTEVADVNRKSRTILKLDKVDYNIPLNKDDFTLEALRKL